MVTCCVKSVSHFVTRVRKCAPVVAMFFAALALSSIAVASDAIPVAAAVKWFAFNSAFIAAHYSGDEAFGSVSSTGWAPAGSTHSVSCGGNDGELHIGSLNTALTLAAGESPLSARQGPTDPKWGMVAELPSASSGTGPTVLQSVLGQDITFEGYLRVWNEGHDVGVVFASNPHHVFEVHPAWKFSAGATHFENRALIKAMPGYSGYGATKFKPVMLAIKAGTWPLAFHDGTKLHLALEKAENFYQLPIKVKSMSTITGGHEVVVDVFSDKAMKKLVYPGLRCVTISGSPIDATVGNLLAVGSKTFLLGFFSVNLKRAADAASGATSTASAIAVPGALEFLIFGRATSSAAATCSSNAP